MNNDFDVSGTTHACGLSRETGYQHVELDRMQRPVHALNPALHANPQLKPLHVATAFAGTGQGVQREPHVAGELLLTQLFPQRCLPGAQVRVDATSSMASTSPAPPSSALQESASRKPKTEVISVAERAMGRWSFRIRAWMPTDAPFRSRVGALAMYSRFPG